MREIKGEEGGLWKMMWGRAKASQRISFVIFLEKKSEWCQESHSSPCWDCSLSEKQRDRRCLETTIPKRGEQWFQMKSMTLCLPGLPCVLLARLEGTPRFLCPSCWTIVLNSASLIHSAKSEWCREESSETVLNKMSEWMMTNSARLNLDTSFGRGLQKCSLSLEPVFMTTLKSARTWTDQAISCPQIHKKRCKGLMNFGPQICRIVDTN